MADDTDRIDLAELIRKLASGWRDAGVCVGICLILGLIYLRVATYQYTATLELVSSQPQSQNNLSQFSGLAAMAGVDLPSLQQGNSPFQLYPETMQSSAVADEVANHNPEIMHRLFRTQWDEAEQKWKRPSGIVAVIVGVMKAIIMPGSPPWAPPGGEELQDVINARVFAQSDMKKPLLTVTFRDRDPKFATHFLVELNNATDRVLRRMTLTRSSQYANYIEGKLATVQQTELRQVLMSTLSAQETLLMMSSSNTPFAAQPLGPARSSLRPTSPNPVIVLLLAIVGGAIVGFGAAFFKLPIYATLERWLIRRPKL